MASFFADECIARSIIEGLVNRSFDRVGALARNRQQSSEQRT
jgi:hypothetical protein